MAERQPKFEVNQEVKTSDSPVMRVSHIILGTFYGPNNSKGIPTILREFAGDYRCQWFIDGEMKQGDFAEETLTAVYHY
ncbi:MAG TPA: hypothetical protein VK154_08895 [Chitinophagales bacterium]|nr:hypothetical protein [Chitinophagales bacterium]